MAMIEDEHIIFDTGRSLYVAGGTVAIGHGHSLLYLSGEQLSQDELTPEERIELAQVMIDRWTAFRSGMMR
jgi:hypothetical protein